ncbi:MAG: protoporphyrinogen oxidase [Thermoleophilia bacterium]|nr:protoporphyrinogen oxidase [Thermoleophilia bacterium]
MSTGGTLRIAVVGGGVGGLAAAWEAKHEIVRRGMDAEVLVLEARERVGGSILTERVEGCLVEGGPDCFVTDKPWGMDLMEEVGLGPHLASTNDARRKTYVLWKGRVHPLPDGLILLVPTRVMPFVTSSLFSWPGKLRMAFDLVLPRKCDGSDETLGDFIRRRLGHEALDKLGEPLVAGIHSGDPETMSIKATFPRFVDMECEQRSLIVAMLRRMRAARKARAAAVRSGSSGRPTRPRTMFATLDGGLGMFTTALARRIGETAIHTGDPVVAVRRGDGAGWVLRTESGAEHGVDGLILATPAYASAGILAGVSPALAAELEAIPYVSSATVTLAFRAAEFPREPDGFGLVVPKAENRRIKAFTWVTSKFFDRAPEDIVLLRCFIRSADGETETMAEEEMVARAREELRSILGVDAEPLWARAYRWNRAMPQYVVGHLDRVARIDALLTEVPGIVLAGGAYRGSGIPDTVRVSREQARGLVEQLAATGGPVAADSVSRREPSA